MVISEGSSINKGAMREDTSWVFIQVRSVAPKHAWRSYSALELEGVCVIWTLKTLAYYFKGCPRLKLWLDHSAQSMKKDLRSLSPRMQKFREVIQANNVDIFFARGIHTQITNALPRAAVGGSEVIETVLRNTRGHTSYAYNRIFSCILET